MSAMPAMPAWPGDATSIVGTRAITYSGIARGPAEPELPLLSRLRMAAPLMK